MPIFRRKVSDAKLILNNMILLLFFFTLCTIPLSPALAATVNLAWNASTGSNIAGYKLYYGTSSGNYSYDVNAGQQTSCSVSGLQEGRRYYFAATAYNTSDVESDYSRELSYTIPTSSASGSTPSDTGGSSGTIIIDNGDPNTAASGKWSPSGASGYYGANSLYSNRSGDSYSFEAASSGAQEVYLWYAASGNRCTNVPIEIYDGNTHLDTITVNQQQNGGQWNLLGTYSFNGTARIITISNADGDCVTSADAVSLVSTSSTAGTTTSGSTSDSGTSTSGSTGDSGTTGTTSDSGASGSTSSSTPSDTGGSSGTIIIDNGDPNTAASGKWSPSGASGYYGANSLYSNRSGDSYSFEVASSGAQEVYLWHAASSNRCTDVPIEIYNGNIHLDTVTINQQQDGGQWNLLGTYTFSGTAKIITVSTGVSNCVTSADAVSLVSTSSTAGTTTSGSTSDSGTTGSTSGSTTSDTGASSGTTIIDNGDPNTAASGKWSPSGASGYYGANSLYSNRSGDSYSFEAASSGAQEVYLWHAASGNRCTNVPIEIYDGNTRLDTVTINQQQDGGQWNLLGTYTFSGTATIIIVSTGVSNCVTSADAVYFFEPN